MSYQIFYQVATILARRVSCEPSEFVEAVEEITYLLSAQNNNQTDKGQEYLVGFAANHPLIKDIADQRRKILAIKELRRAFSEMTGIAPSLKDSRDAIEKAYPLINANYYPQQG